MGLVTKVPVETGVPKETPRQTRQRLAKMEGWFRDHAGEFSPGNQVFLRIGFEHATTPAHADHLAATLRQLRKR